MGAREARTQGASVSGGYGRDRGRSIAPHSAPQRLSSQAEASSRTSAIALVPARSGSARVPGKNVRPLAGHPLIAYSIAAAHEAELFDTVVVSTDSEEIAEIARHS